VDDPFDLATRIPDPNLRRLAETRSSQTVSVLIEPDLPRQRLDFEEMSEPGTGRPRPARVAPETADETREIETRTASTQVFLRGVLDSDPRWLRSSRVFVADVTGDQLAAIARSPLTRAIHPNRQLR
jgi:hypothetical protein